MSYQDFLNNYNLFTDLNSLQYYQVISAIPKRVLIKAKIGALIKKELDFNNTFYFCTINSVKAGNDGIDVLTSEDIENTQLESQL